MEDIEQFKKDLVQYIPNLRRYARKLKRNFDEAEELLQQSLLHAIEKAHTYENQGSLREWLFVLMHHLNVTIIRRNIRHATEVVYEDFPVNENIIAAITVNEIKEYLKKRPKYARVLMRITAGDLWEECAKHENLPLGTVRSRMHRIRSELKDLYQIT